MSSVPAPIPSSAAFPLESGFREKALQWASRFPYCSYLTSSQLPYPGGGFSELLAVSRGSRVFSLGPAPFEALQQLHQKTGGWLFGYFTYDLKNSIHGLESRHPDSIGFPDCTFFQPDILLSFKGNRVEIAASSPQAVWAEIGKTAAAEVAAQREPAIRLQPHMSRAEYLQKVKAIQQHILEGDCYELNLCQEFSAGEVSIEPLPLFLQLNQLSPTPFAAFQRFHSHYLLCASPERFLKKEGSTLLSQPIKGTIRRGSSLQEDQQLKVQLRNDEKELAENLMIVDLVRNDLARSSLPGSVVVDELFGVYSFPQVHQMISTVRARLRPEVPFAEALQNAFPMGSMTGAPKRKVMELIEQYENSRRGLYSGAVGFISPQGNFDFNVVIRSLLYNEAKKVLSFQVGGAITYDSVPEKEYEECLLKARALLQLLGQDTTGTIFGPSTE